MFTRKRNLLYPVLSFFISILLYMIISYQKAIVPFGENTLFMSDLGAQYMPFLSYFKEVILNGSGVTYSFNNGIGDNMLPLIAYYLTSPMNLLTLFFSTANLPVAVNLLIGLKIALASFSMSFYFQATYHHKDFMTVLLPVLYAFCGFTAAYFYNIMWLDILFWLPLVVLALQILIDQGKKIPYIICLIGTIGSNYYMGYMVCFFLILYFFYWTGKRSDKKLWLFYFQNDKKAFIRFVSSSIIAALFLGILLVPTAIGMMQTGKSEFNFSIFIPPILYGLDGFAGLGFGISDFTSRLHHLPTFYTGFITLLLSTTYFFNQKIMKKERKAGMVFLGILFLSTWVQPFLIVFQMFQKSAGFPFRNSFLISFMLVQFAYESWQKKEGIPLQKLKKSVWILEVCFMVAYFFNHWTTIYTQYPSISVWMLVLNLLFLLVNGFILLYILPKGWLNKSWIGMISILVLFEGGFQFSLMMKGADFGKMESYQNYVQEVAENLEQVRGGDDPFVRVDNTNLHASDFGVASNGYNEGMLFGYNGVTSYTSTLPKETVEFYQNLGLYSWNERRISYIGSTPLTDLLLNVGYQLHAEESQIHLSENQEVNGVGFLVPTEAKMIEMQKNSPFLNQNRIFQSLYQTEEHLFKKTASFQIHEKKVDQTYHSTIELRAASKGILYAFLPYSGKNTNYFTIQVNGEKVPTKISLKNASLLELGEVDKGESVSITMETTKPTKFDKDNVQVFDRAVFNRRSSNQIMSPISLNKGRLSGQIEGRDPSAILLMSIPYDKGWKVVVDGESKPVISLLDGLLGVEVDRGKHVIEWKYTPPGYGIGKALSIIGIFLFSVVLLKEKFHK